MFTKTDEQARAKAIARNPRESASTEQSHLAYLEKESQTQNTEAAMSIAQVAHALRRKVRKNYRGGDQPEATVRINPNWHHTPGTTAVQEQLAAKLKAAIGKDGRFTLEVKFFNAILPAQDERDDMSFYPAGSATLRIIMTN